MLFGFWTLPCRTGSLPVNKIIKESSWWSPIHRAKARSGPAGPPLVPLGRGIFFGGICPPNSIRGGVIFCNRDRFSSPPRCTPCPYIYDLKEAELLGLLLKFFFILILFCIRSKCFDVKILSLLFSFLYSVGN